MVVALERSDRVVLHNISWEQYEKLLEDLGDRPSARIAYDNGTLEIMTPLPEHEYFKEVIGDTIKEIAEEIELNYESYGSATWRKPVQMAGVEPDNCFYFQNEAAVRGRLDLDLNQGDPPPDLVLEIDLKNKSLNRFPIYARLAVPELWCYDAGELKIYHLQNDKYIEAQSSLALPMLPIRELPHLIESHRAEGRRAIRRAVREWAKKAS
jgi:Uma2 family endonuclease